MLTFRSLRLNLQASHAQPSHLCRRPTPRTVAGPQPLRHLDRFPLFQVLDCVAAVRAPKGPEKTAALSTGRKHLEGFVTAAAARPGLAGLLRLNERTSIVAAPDRSLLMEGSRSDGSWGLNPGQQAEDPALQLADPGTVRAVTASLFSGLVCAAFQL